MKPHPLNLRGFSGTSSIRCSSLYIPIESASGVSVTPSESQWESFGDTSGASPRGSHH